VATPPLATPVERATGKLKEHTVPRGLHEATAVFRHEGIGNLAVFAECAGGPDLVEAHEPRVACHVNRDYGRQPASDPSWLLLPHGQAALAAPSLPGCRLPTSLGLGAALVNKWNHWPPNTTLVELLADAISKSDVKGAADPSRHFAGA
jgi:hypothetical protein